MTVTLSPPPVMNPRTAALLHAPIVPILLRLAWPNVLVMLAQSSTGLIETYWVSRLGTDALAGMAPVPRRDADADDLRRGNGRRHLLGRRPCPGRPPPGRRRRAGPTNVTVAVTTGLVGAAAGPGALAGYGTGARLEYLLIALTFGLGMALYFASQGAGRLLWPLLAGLLRMLVAIGGGWLAMRATGSLAGLFTALAAGLVLYGGTIALAVHRGAWRVPAQRSL